MGFTYLILSPSSWGPGWGHYLSLTVPSPTTCPGVTCLHPHCPGASWIGGLGP